PRLTAVLSYLTGCHHVSRRGIEEIAEAAFEAPLALGTVAALEQEVSAALAGAHAQAVTTVRQAPVKNVDETGWKEGGQKRWLWVAASKTVAAFLIHARRGIAGLNALLGGTVKGFLISDRWSAYNAVAVRRRQVCCAHLKRAFQQCVDRGGPAQ